MAPISTSKHQRVRAKLTTEQKAKQRNKFVNLTDAIATACETYQEEARAIAQDHGQSLKWTRRQLHTTKTFLNRWSANPWNAFVRKNLNKYNEGHGTGDRMKLPAFIKAHHAELLSKYYCLMRTEKEDLRKSVVNLRQSCVKVVHANPKVLQKNINATFNIMQNEVLKACIWLCEVMPNNIMSRSSSTHQKWCRLSRMFSAWNQNALHLKSSPGLSVICAGTVSQRLPLTKLVSLCCQNIQDGLDIIVATLNPAPKKRVVMNYKNYEWKIVETYGIALDGFPLGTMQNPGKIGHHENLVQLLDSLINNSCAWLKFPDSECTECTKNNCECQANGEQVYKAQKRRAAKATSVKSKETIDDGDDEQHSKINEEAGEV
ncbi:hypothetical protein DFH29DRAFT_1004997 [Suillus ampliporus]|nr:hypothetical protein DFH29DRAFT_1004997 [Suillus ampliporus]